MANNHLILNVSDEGGRRVVEVTRSCVTYQEDSCYSGNQNGISAEICVCSEDLCNRAEMAVTYKSMTIVSLVFLGYFLTYISSLFKGFDL